MEELIQKIQQRVVTLPEEAQEILRGMYGTEQLKLFGFIVGPEISSAIAGSINEIANKATQQQTVIQPQQEQPMPTPPGLGMRPQQ